MLVLHAEKLPDASEFFRGSFGVEPDEVLFFQSPTQGGWNGASFQGACFRAVRVDEHPKGTFEKLYDKRPIKVLQCDMTAAQTDAVRAFVYEELLPALADWVGGVVSDGSTVSYRGDPARRGSRPGVFDLKRLKPADNPNDGANDWSDL